MCITQPINCFFLLLIFYQLLTSLEKKSFTNKSRCETRNLCFTFAAFFAFVSRGLVLVHIYKWRTRWKAYSRASRSSLRSSVCNQHHHVWLFAVFSYKKKIWMDMWWFPENFESSTSFVLVVKEHQMETGHPTDVKHVAHIGWDSPTGSAASPSWVHNTLQSS